MSRGYLVAACVIAGIVGVVGAVVGVAALSFRGLEPRTELTAAEKSLLVQADDLVAFGIVPDAGPHAESFRVKRNLDHSVELEYTYESTAAGARFVLHTEAEVNATSKDAAGSFRARVKAYQMGVRLTGKEGTRLVDQAKLPALGADTYVGQLCVGGKPAGSTVVLWQGRTAFSVQLSGLFIDDPGDWQALLAPRLANEGAVTCE
jgi:hypothetical protein